MSLVRKVAVNAVAAATGRVLLVMTGVVSVGIATRYLGLEAYGALTTSTAFVTALAPLNDIGVSAIAARELAKFPEERDRLIGSVLTLALGMSLVTTAVGVGAIHLLYPGADNETVRNAVVIMLLIALPTSAAAAPASAYLIATQRAWTAMAAGVGGSLLTLLLLVLTWTLDWGFYGVAVAYAATATGYGAVLLTFAAGKIRFRPWFDRVLLRKLLVWAAPLGLSTILAALYLRAPILVLGMVSSKAQVGLFGVGFKVLEGLRALPYFVTITLMPEFARMAENRDRLDTLVERAVRLLQFFVIPMLIGIVTLADEVTAVVGGDEFEGSASVIRILAVGVAAAFISGVLGQAMVALNRQAQLLMLVSAILVLNVGLCLALIPSLGARGAALGFVIAEIAALLGVMLLFGRSGRRPSLRVQPALGVAGAAMGGVGLLATLAGESLNPAVVLVVGGGAAMAAYVGCLYALKAVPEEIQDGVVRPLWGRVRPRR